MQPLEFREIADLLRLSRAAEISPKPNRESAGNWELYSGEYRVHTQRFPFEVLYLRSKATADSLRIAKQQAFQRGKTQVVYSPSLDQRQSAHKELFAKDAANFWNTREYLASFVTEELNAYRERIADLKPEYYQDPFVEVPAGLRRKIPNPVLNLLTDPAADSPDETSDAGTLGVVLAPPGQGKTYLSRHLASSLARFRKDLLPIYIDSPQWRSMNIEDLGSIWKTLAHSFRFFETPIGWLEGCEEEFLTATLKAGLFRVIFDGFDEYILRNQGRVSTLDALHAIGTLASDTGARIVLTARTTFWRAELGDRVASPVENRPLELAIEGLRRIGLFEIQPFDSNQGRSFFEKRLKDPRATDRAVAVHRALSERSKDLAGRGFVLWLVADLVEKQAEEPKFKISDDPVHWLMVSLCERERLRQELPLTAIEQLAFLKTFVSEKTMGEDPTTSLVNVALYSACPRFSEDAERAEIIRKLISHPLICKEAPEDRWVIPQQQIEVALLADFLVDAGKSGDTAVLNQFRRKASLEEGFAADVASMLVSRIMLPSAAEDGERLLSQVIAQFLGRTASATLPEIERDSLRRLAVMALLGGVDERYPEGSSHEERTKLLLKMLPGGIPTGLLVTGAIARLDLAGVVFDRCKFEHVRWVNCTFSEATIFRSCSFVGGSQVRCKGLGLAQFDGETRRDDEAMHFLGAEAIGAGRKKYGTEDLKADIRTVVSKLLGRGGVGLKTVRAADLRTGKISVSLHRDVIVDELTRSLLEEHEISGVGKGYNVSALARECVRFFLANNVFTGPLQEVYVRLCKKLGLT